MSGFFVTGGTMKPDAPSYIERHADTELYEAVLSAQYCTVLTTRQMGKSSLMARTALRLRQHRVACATVDLQGKGDRNPPREQWYYGVVKQIADSLPLAPGWTEWWKQQQLLLPAQQFTDFFADVVLKQITGSIAVFIDEVDWMIRLPFSDEFFAAIRSCYNRRATDPVFDRLTFILVGSAAPAQLIRDPTRTPFNIAKGIELTDFTRQEAAPLAQHLGPEGDTILDRVFYWTDGHPYLTQMLCAESPETPEAVDADVQKRLLSTAARQQENNLKFVGDRLTQGTGDLRRVLKTYREILREKPVRDIPNSPIHTSLRLSGVAKPDTELRLRVRNRVYRTVFDDRWVAEKTRIPVKYVAIAASVTVLLGIYSYWYLVVYPKPYIVAIEDASQDIPYAAYDALNRPFHRKKAEELLAQYFERIEDRESAIMVRARAGDGARVADLVGQDYLALEHTFNIGAELSYFDFSPAARLVAVASADGTRIFDLSAGKELRFIADLHGSASFAWSSDGSRIAIASNSGFISVIDAATGQERTRLLDVNGAKFSADNRILAAVSSSGIAKLFNAVTYSQIVAFPVGENTTLAGLSPDGSLLVANTPESIKIFETRRGHLRCDIPASRFFDYRSDGLVAIETPGGSLANYDPSNCKPHPYHLSGDHQRFLGLGDDRAAFKPRESILQLYDLKNHLEYLKFETGGADSFATSVDGKFFAIASRPGVVRIFRTRPQSLPREPDLTQLLEAKLDRKGTRIALSWGLQNCSVRELSTGAEVARFHRTNLRGVALSPDGKSIALGFGPILEVIDLASGRQLWQTKRWEIGLYVEALAYSADGHELITSEENGEASFLNAADGHKMRLTRVRGGRDLAPEVLALTDDGTVLARSSSARLAPNGDMRYMGYRGYSVDLIEVATERNIAEFAYPDRIRSVAFSHDGQLLTIQTTNWLHLYRRSGDRWQPIANRRMASVIPNTVRFLPPTESCPHCIELVRTPASEAFKLESFNFDEYPAPLEGDAAELVKTWGSRLGLAFDSRGRLVPVQ